jgi:hypothetical protein
MTARIFLANSLLRLVAQSNISAVEDILFKIDATTVPIDGEPCYEKTKLCPTGSDRLMNSAGKESVENADMFARGDSGPLSWIEMR